MTLRVFVLMVLLAEMTSHAQTILEGAGPGEALRLLPSDVPVLEGAEIRRDFPCSVTPTAPELGFDFGYHSGYEVKVPLRDLAGDGNTLTAIFRVTGRSGARRATYFVQKWTVPAIAEDAYGATQLRGIFVLGEGRYQVEWLMRDRAERVCTARWQVGVEPRGKDRLIPLQVNPGSVLPEPTDLFAFESTAKQEDEFGLHVVVLLHIAPRGAGAAGMGVTETAAPLAIVRSIAREPRIRTYSITAFNLEASKILFRQQDTRVVDFPALGEAVRQLHLGTVSAQELLERDRRGEFLSRLVAEEVSRNRPDAVIFVGPKTTDDTYTLNRSLQELGRMRCPVFYLNYNAHPAVDPWKDLIGSAVRSWKGVEYTIAKPRDLFMAWEQVMSKLTDKPRGGVPARNTAITELLRGR